MKDAAGREIDYLRLSVTDRCNLRCIYCMPEEGIPLVEHDDILTVEETLELTGLIITEVGIRKVRITGGEPLVRKGLPGIVRGLSGMKLRELVMTTNGLLLKAKAQELADAGIQRFNVSLDSLDPARLRSITRGDANLDSIEAAITAAAEATGRRVKVNCVVMRGINSGEIADFLLWSRRMNVTVRFIEHMPSILPSGVFFSRDDMLKAAGELGKVEPAGESGTALHYRIAGMDLEFGVIAPFSRPVCSSCNRIRLSAQGELHTCLAGGPAVSLRELLRGGASRDSISTVLRRAVEGKPESHGGCVSTDMWRIGG